MSEAQDMAEAIQETSAVATAEVTVVTPYGKTVTFLREAFPVHTPLTKQVQFGCHFEEVTEMLDAMDSKDYALVDLIMDAKGAVKALAERLKNIETPVDVLIDEKELLDSLADQIVTATSVGMAQGWDMTEALNVVGDSNLSKFEDGKPVFKDNGKIAKGINYIAPDWNDILYPPIHKAKPFTE